MEKLLDSIKLYANLCVHLCNLNNLTVCNYENHKNACDNKLGPFIAPSSVIVCDLSVHVFNLN